MNPLEKELLIRRFKGNPRIKVYDFCVSNDISEAAFRKWMKQYEAAGLEGLARQDAEFKDLLPEGSDLTLVGYKREVIKLRIENERLKKKLCRSDERGWGTGVCSLKAEEFEIVDLLSRDNPIRDICALMGVSRAGYYKWKNRGPSPRDTKREEIVALVKQVHAAHPTHGYRWTAAYIRINMQVIISDNHAYKCYRYLGVKAETKHRVRCSPRKVRDLYPNLIFSAWETVDRPRQIIVSDMTVIKVRYKSGKTRWKNYGELPKSR